jgi:hypothetical protein
MSPFVTSPCHSTSAAHSLLGFSPGPVGAKKSVTSPEKLSGFAELLGNHRRAARLTALAG